MKKLTFLSIAFFLLFMVITPILKAQPEIQIQKGNFKFDYMVAGYELDKGWGDRKAQMTITFSKVFREKPEVIIAVNSVDAKGSSVRYDVFVTNVTTSGFTIMAKTWGDSQLFWFGGNWFAIGIAKQ